MREELQTYSRPCNVLSVYRVFLYKEFSDVMFCKMSKTFLWGLYFWFLMKTVKIAKKKKKLLIRAATNFPAEFSRSKHDSATVMFTG